MQGLKVQVVVINPAGVVPHALADVLRQLRPVPHQPFQGPAVVLRAVFQQLVEIVHVGVKVLVVVEVHGALVQLRQQGIVGVGQGRQGKGVMCLHRASSSLKM